MNEDVVDSLSLPEMCPSESVSVMELLSAHSDVKLDLSDMGGVGNGGGDG